MSWLHLLMLVFGNHIQLYALEDDITVEGADIIKKLYAEHPRCVRLQLPPKSPDINVRKSLGRNCSGMEGVG